MKLLNFETKIDEIFNSELEGLLDILPSDGVHQAKFTQVGDSWIFKFTFASINAYFNAIGSGSTPDDAFSTAKFVLLRQIRQWRETRFTTADFDARLDTQVRRSPSVIIVDDDVETALATEFMFKQLGCRTEIVCDPEGVHRKLSNDEADLIVLDWKLSPELEGRDVIERANRLIGAFADLRTRFENTRSRVITHSVLPKSDIQLPSGGNFKHFDHWQKPLPYSELLTRGTDALTACGF